MSGPDSSRALALYRREAAGYDRRVSRFTRRYRQRAISRLALQPGDAVLDVACGTGVNLPLLATAVGRTGRVVGIDLSREMLAVARERVRREALTKVVLIEAAVERPTYLEASMRRCSHSLMTCSSHPRRLKLFNHLRPGARVAVFGGKRAPWWPQPVVRWIGRR